MGDGWSRPRPGPFTAGKQTWYPLYRWMGPTAGLYSCGKLRPPLGMDPRTVHPVASRMLKWIQFNAFHTIWKEVALNGMCGASPKFVWVSWEEVQSILRQRCASQYLNMWSPDWESGAICRRQRRLMTAHVLEHIGLGTYCLSEVTRTSASGLFLQKYVWNEEGADEWIKWKFAE